MRVTAEAHAQSPKSRSNVSIAKVKVICLEIVLKKKKSENAHHRHAVPAMQRAIELLTAQTNPKSRVTIAVKKAMEEAPVQSLPNQSLASTARERVTCLETAPNQRRSGRDHL